MKPFISTPREYRVLRALLDGPKSRLELNTLVGALNLPHVILELRAKGWKIITKRTVVKDRDGKTCRPGIYSLSMCARVMALMVVKKWKG